MDKRRSKQSKCLMLIGCLVALALAGCQNDEIRHYQVPRVENLEAEPATSGKSVRLLGAILPHGEKTWFFKLMGDADAVKEHKEEFEKFVQSVQFTSQPEPPLEWKVPEGWRREAGSDMRYATFRLGPKDASLELTVIPLGKEAASVLANVNRWRDQVSLKPISETELNKIVMPFKADGTEGTLVDLTGSEKKGKKPPFADMGGFPRKAPAAAPKLTYRTPEGWQEQPSSGSMRVAAFLVKEGGQKAEMTVILLPGEAGGLLSNVNRWRDQIKLAPIKEDQLRQDLRKIDVAGSLAPFLTLLGPDGPQRQAILVAMAARGEQTWFFKLMGPADLVLKQQPAFESFLASVRFDGGKGGFHE